VFVQKSPLGNKISKKQQTRKNGTRNLKESKKKFVVGGGPRWKCLEGRDRTSRNSKKEENEMERYHNPSERPKTGKLNLKSQRQWAQRGNRCHGKRWGLAVRRKKNAPTKGPLGPVAWEYFSLKQRQEQPLACSWPKKKNVCSPIPRGSDRGSQPGQTKKEEDERLRRSLASSRVDMAECRCLNTKKKEGSKSRRILKKKVFLSWV